MVARITVIGHRRGPLARARPDVDRAAP